MTTTADGGAGSLRKAISDANVIAVPAKIKVPPGTYKITKAGSGQNANASGDFDVHGTS